MPAGGVTTGLQLWLVFFLSLYLSGYGVALSICFGALGGLSGGLCYSWWHRGAVTSTPPRSPEVLERVRDRIERWRRHQGDWNVGGWRPFRAPRSVYKRRTETSVRKDRSETPPDTREPSL